jgi:hypothetical protein
MVLAPIGFRRDYEQNIIKKKLIGKKGFIVKRDVYENATLLLKAKIYVIFKNKDIEKIHLKKENIEKLGEEISKHLIESSKEILERLSKDNFDKFEEEHKEELKEYKEHPKFPAGFKVKEISKEEWEKEHHGIEYPKEGLFYGYPQWCASHQLEFKDFSLMIIFEIRKDFPVVTEDSIIKLAKLIKTDLKLNAYEAVEEAEKMKSNILKSDRKFIEKLFESPSGIFTSISMIDSIKQFKKSEKLSQDLNKSNSLWSPFSKKKEESNERLKIAAGAILPYKISRIDGEKIKFEPTELISEEEKWLFNRYKEMVKKQREDSSKLMKTNFIYGFWCRDCKKVPQDFKECFKRKHTILQAIIGENSEYKPEKSQSKNP